MRRSAQSHQSRYARSVWPCVITTPFGLPVVPDVNTTSLGSSAASDAMRASSSRRDDRVSRVRGTSSQPSRASSGVAGEQDRLLERGEVDAGIGEERGVVGVEEPADREQHARAAAGEDERGLGAAEARVDGDEHGTRGRDAERGDDPLERVRRPDRDAVAALDARRAPAPRAASATAADSAANSMRRVPSTTASASPNRRAASRTIAGIVGHVTSLRVAPDPVMPACRRRG